MLLAVKVTVLVPGTQLMPTLLLDAIDKLGTALVPFTFTVNDVLLQPVNVFVTVKLYVPFWLTCTLLLFYEPTIPKPDQV